MRFEISSRTILVLAAAWALLACHDVSAQALTEIREWTNADGKKLNAELLVFGKEADDGIVRLRMKDGVVHKVEESTLSREDRALILKKRFEKQFRSNYNGRMDAHFFYSNLIPKSEEEKNTIAYIGNDEKGGWLRTKVSLKSGIGRDGVALMIVGKGAPPIRIEYDSGDLEFFGRNVQLDLSLTKESQALATILKSPSSMKFLIEKENKTYGEVALSDLEVKSLARVSDAFEKLQELTTDHIWWATFQELDLDEIAAKQKAEKEAAEMAAQKPEPEEAQPFTEKLTWEFEESGETFDAALLKFERQRAKFDDRTVAALELIPANRELLATLRLERTMKPKWHPVDDDYTWHWPKDDACRNGLLFVLERETGKPRLMYQQVFEIDPSERPTSGRLMGKVVDLDLPLSVAGDVLKLRKETETIVWFPLSDEYCEVLVVASPALEGLRFENEVTGGELVSGEFSEVEFKSSVEAIEIFRLWHSLVKNVE